MTRTVPPPSRKRTRTRVVPLAKVPAKRLWIVFLILCTGLVGLVGRMAWLQLVQSGELESRARRLQTQTSATLGQRRPIVDRTGRLVAMDEIHYRLWAHPRYFNLPGDAPGLVRPPEDVVELLATPLAQPPTQLLKELGQQRSGVKLAEGLDPETAKRIRSLGISGLDLEAYPQRVYPQGDLFANVVGFLNDERVPQAGLEQSRNGELQRHEQSRRLRRGAAEHHFHDLAPGAFYGDDLRLQLTLDARLQELAVKPWRPRWPSGRPRGAAIVMDATNGELLVLASTPTYDKSLLAFAPARFREWSVQDLYEPSPLNRSIWLALQEKAISPTDRVTTSVSSPSADGRSTTTTRKPMVWWISPRSCRCPAMSAWFRRCSASITAPIGTG